MKIILALLVACFGMWFWIEFKNDGEIRLIGLVFMVSSGYYIKKNIFP